MRVQLGVEVARGIVAEGRGHHLLAAHADHGPRRLVLHPGPDSVLLDPREGPAHRPVMRLDDAPVATYHREQRDRLWRREGDVAAGAMMELPVLAAAPELRPVRHLALEDPAEGVRIDRPREPEGRRTLARPAARFPVRRVVLGVIAVALVVAGTLGGRRDLAD